MNRWANFGKGCEIAHVVRVWGWVLPPLPYRASPPNTTLKVFMRIQCASSSDLGGELASGSFQWTLLRSNGCKRTAQREGAFVNGPLRAADERMDGARLSAVG